MPKQELIVITTDNTENHITLVEPVGEDVGLDFIKNIRTRQRRLEEIAIEMFGLAAGEEIVIGGGIHRRI